MSENRRKIIMIKNINITVYFLKMSSWRFYIYLNMCYIVHSKINKLKILGIPRLSQSLDLGSIFSKFNLPQVEKSPDG